MKGLRIAILLVLTLVTLAVLVALWPLSGAGLRAKDTSVMFPLVRPAFAQTTAFPEEEAGLAAYLNVGRLEFDNIYQPVASLPSVERIEGTDGTGWLWVRLALEDRSSSYRASIPVHVYIDVNGWAAAWVALGGELLRWESAFPGTPIVEDKNNLEVALESVLSAMSVDFNSRRDQLQYFDFRYPAAKQLVMFSVRGGNAASFIIPDGLNVVMGSLVGLNTDCCVGSWVVKINGLPVAQRSGTGMEIVALSQGIVQRYTRDETMNVIQPAGQLAGATFSTTVSGFGLADRDGGGSVSVADVSIDTDWVRVTNVDPIGGSVTFQVLVESATARDFTLTYRSTNAFPLYRNVSYQVENVGGVGTASAVILVIATP